MRKIIAWRPSEYATRPIIMCVNSFATQSNTIRYNIILPVRKPNVANRRGPPPIRGRCSCRVAATAVTCMRLFCPDFHRWFVVLPITESISSWTTRLGATVTFRPVFDAFSRLSNSKFERARGLEKKKNQIYDEISIDGGVFCEWHVSVVKKSLLLSAAYKKKKNLLELRFKHVPVFLKATFFDDFR